MPWQGETGKDDGKGGVVPSHHHFGKGKSGDLDYIILALGIAAVAVGLYFVLGIGFAVQSGRTRLD